MRPGVCHNLSFADRRKLYVELIRFFATATPIPQIPKIIAGFLTPCDLKSAYNKSITRVIPHVANHPTFILGGARRDIDRPVTPEVPIANA